MYIQNTMKPYKVLPHDGIQYSVCRNFDHISRYRNLRQVIQAPEESFRSIDLETPNPIEENNLSFYHHEVSPDEENRLDLISYRYLGSASYNWAIAYFNDIDDGFTVRSGQKIRIPKNITDLMQVGEILQSIPALQLNLGSE